jgi:hypothetical protein
MMMTDGTELDNDTLEAFLETSIGIDWMQNQIMSNLY